MRFEFKTVSQGDDCVCHITSIPRSAMDEVLPKIEAELKKFGFIYIPVERDFVCTKFDQAKMLDQIFTLLKPFEDKSDKA